MKTLVCTVCCRDKLTEPGLIPARKRYLSKRIARVGFLADAAGFPFAILSGKYGLIDAEHPIPHYDKLMQPEEVDPLATANAHYLVGRGIERVIFLAADLETDPRGKPYLASIREGAKRAGVILEVIFIPPYPERLW